MTTKVVFTHAARADLRSIAEYIAAHSPQRARTYVSSLRIRLETKLSTFPKSGPGVGAYRCLVLDNYVAVYRLSTGKDRVEVVIVTEGHRDWRRMIEDIS